jgi:hypothetical protein
MTVCRIREEQDRANAVLRDNRILFYSKRVLSAAMAHIDYGLTTYKKEVLRDIPGDAVYDLADLLSDLANRGELGGYEVPNRFYEIGSLHGLEEFEGYIRRMK